MRNEEQRNEKGNTEYKILNIEYPMSNVEVNSPLTIDHSPKDDQKKEENKPCKRFP
jgi:hypothetical protein